MFSAPRWIKFLLKVFYRSLVWSLRNVERSMSMDLRWPRWRLNAVPPTRQNLSNTGVDISWESVSHNTGDTVSLCGFHIRIFKVFSLLCRTVWSWLDSHIFLHFGCSLKSGVSWISSGVPYSDSPFNSFLSNQSFQINIRMLSLSVLSSQVCCYCFHVLLLGVYVVMGLDDIKNLQCRYRDFVLMPWSSSA